MTTRPAGDPSEGTKGRGEATPRPWRPKRATLSAMPNGRRGYPRPPAHIWTLMEDAGRTNDPIALGLAHAAYEQWLKDEGFTPDHHTGAHIPESVWND